MKPVVLHSQATAEIREAVAFYDARRDGLGDEFADAVQHAIDIIGRQPKAFAPYKRGYRKYVLARFPFLIFYEEFDSYVWVPTVHHASREPDQWMDREPEDLPTGDDE